jgi:hypothetical protein
MDKRIFNYLPSNFIEEAKEPKRPFTPAEKQLISMGYWGSSFEDAMAAGDLVAKNLGKKVVWTELELDKPGVLTIGTNPKPEIYYSIAKKFLAPMNRISPEYVNFNPDYKVKVDMYVKRFAISPLSKKTDYRYVLYVAFYKADGSKMGKSSYSTVYSAGEEYLSDKASGLLYGFEGPDVLWPMDAYAKELDAKNKDVV